MKNKGLLKFICFPSSHLVKMPNFFITVSKSYIWHTYLNDYSHKKEEKETLWVMIDMFQDIVESLLESK